MAEEDPDREEGRRVKASFASWKLDVIKAMTSDKNLLASDFRVAVALLQHLNSGTWLIFPSQETLAELTHMTPRNVALCLERLKEAGWLRWDRGNRQKSNQYDFDAGNLADALADLKQAAAERRRRRSERKKQGSDMKPVSGQKPVLTRSPVHVATGSRLPTNTYRGTKKRSPG